MKNKAFDYQHPFTIWEEIKSNIETDIINNVFRVGDRVPSINQICQIYSVSGVTAVKVLESLQNDGILLKRRGVGYFVMPYAKDKLIKKHKKTFEVQIEKIVKSAKENGYNKEDFVETFLLDFEQAWNELPHGEEKIDENEE